MGFGFGRFSLKENARLQALSVFVVVTAVFIVTCSYWLSRFWRRRRHFGFEGRKSGLTTACVLCALLYMASRATALWSSLYNSTSQPNAGDWVLNVVHTFLTTVGFMGGGALLCLRIWLTYFHVRLAVANSDNQWMSLITQPVSYFAVVLCTAEMVHDMDLQKAAAAETAAASNSNTSSGVSPMAISSAAKSSSGPASRRSVRTVMKGISSSLPRRRNSSIHSKFPSTSVHSKTKSVAVARDGEDEDGQQRSQWFFENKYSYGNTRLLTKRLLWVLSPITLVIWLLQLYKGTAKIAKSMFFIAMLFFVAFFFAISRNFPSFFDALRVCDECVLLAYQSALLLINLIVYSAAVFLSANDWWFNLAFNCVCVVQGLVLVLTQTKWVVHNFEHQCECDACKAQRQSQLDAVMVAGNGYCAHRCKHYCDFDLFDLCLDVLVAAHRGDGSGQPTANAKVGAFSSVLQSLSLRSTVSDVSKSISLRDIIASEDGFRYFMAHLFREFSYENLLCAIELTQFSECVTSEATAKWRREEEEEAAAKIQSEEKKEERGFSERFLSIVSSGLGTTKKLTPSSTSAGAHFGSFPFVKLPKFPESVAAVKSSISWNGRLSIEQKFLALVAKYIKPEAEMVVNISFLVRRPLLHLADFLLDGERPAGVLLPLDAHVFDEVIDEMLRLMKDSMWRFKTTKAYAIVRRQWAASPESGATRMPANGTVKFSPLNTSESTV